jgi:hypothetical protein
MKQLPTSTLENLVKIRRVLNTFRLLSADMTIGECISLVEIANGMTDDGAGLTITGLSKLCDFPLSSTSRYTIKMAGQAKKGAPTEALVTNKRNPMNDVSKELRLTPRGQLVIDQLCSIVE